MPSNPALAAAFRRIALGFLLESAAFFLLFLPMTHGVEPVVLLLGAVLMMNGFYLAAKEVSGFKNPLILKVIVCSLLLSRAVMLLIFDSTFGLGLFITAAQILLELFCLRDVRKAVGTHIPAVASRTGTSVQSWATVYAVAYLCMLFSGDGPLSVAAAGVLLIACLVYRIKYYRYLHAAARNA